MMKEMGIGTVKSLGQHFIFDLNVTDKIARSAPGLESANVIEVGPGAGSLTRSLLRCGAKSLVVVEKDKRMIPILERIAEQSQPKIRPGLLAAPGSPEPGLVRCHGASRSYAPRGEGEPDECIESDRMRIVEGDAIRLGREFYKQIPAPRAIVSNLPYNVGTELLIGWLHDSDLFESLTLMFQKEVAERIVAGPGSSKYGRLSVLAAMHCDAKILFQVSRSAFNPPPKVENAVVQLIAHRKYSKDLCEKVEKVSAALFANRRKMIRSAIKGFDWALVGLTGEERAEELSVDKFIEIGQKLKTKNPI